MTLSYSDAAMPTSFPARNLPTLTPSSPDGSSSTLPEFSPTRHTAIGHLILDAGPLLSLTPLRYLASTFHTTPLVIAELRDPKAREHWDRLGLSGVDVKVEMPEPDAMAKVIAFAKKTGDYAVLSQTDLSVIALTYQYEVAANGEEHIRTIPGERKGQARSQEDSATAQQGNENGEDVGDSSSAEQDDEHEEFEPGEASIEQVLSPPAPPTAASERLEDIRPVDEFTTTTDRLATEPATSSTKYDAVEDIHGEDDGDGDWITPSNLSSHRNHDLGLLSADGASTAPASPIAAACMTGDFAVQNVLLGMGLRLVGEGGKRISKVRSWVLRCHACFKICKDSSKRFCPSCGNPSLLRTTVTTSATTGEQKIHLKKNFQYHLRGTKFCIPDAKPGRAKGQQKGGSGLILREDQAEWQDAVKAQERRREKEDRRVAKGTLQGWNDPDWLPEIITVGVSGKGRSGGNGMPTIGHGRKNPNQARRKR